MHIEALLLMARYDDGFRRLLLEDRERALRESGIAFSPAERTVLLNTSRGALESGIREFSPRGVSRESLPSWREAAAVLMLLVSLMVTDTASGERYVSRGIEPSIKPCKNILTDAEIDRFEYGFCGDDVFRMSAQGAPAASAADRQSRKDSAYRTAVLMAQVGILEKFQGACISGTGIMKDDDTGPSDLWKSDLKAVVKGGSVIAAKWDANDSCRVVFEVRKKGLRQWGEKCW
jgi:hypothetical protein